jgi:DNA primase
MSPWINFKRLRENLNFEAVLKHYGVEVKSKGDQHHGYCPLPNHQGKRNSPSFSANLKKGIFQCFGCGAKGNVLEFAVLMEKVAPHGAGFHNVAIELQKRFCPCASEPPPPQRRQPVATSKPKSPISIVINGPLDFELQALDPKHPYLLERGFSSETATHFGFGFCSRGLFKDRIAIPLHDQQGSLIGYAGRVVDDNAIGQDNPRYRFPSKRQRNGVYHEFKKSLFLYNAFRLQAPVDELILVEGFTAVWWLHQNGLPNVVATMGVECSGRQLEIIASVLKPSGRLWLMPDGDDAGQRLGQSVVGQISIHRFVRWIKLEEKCQATDLTPDKLKQHFTM